MTRLTSAGLGALLVISLGLAAADYSASDDVVQLTAGNFDAKVVQSDELWFVEFYAPWCGHCKALEPEWKKAASALRGIVNVGAVNMDDHQSVGAPYNVRGFPTIKIFSANKKSPQDFNAERNAQAIIDSAMSELKSLVAARLRSGSSGGGGGGGGGSRSGGGGGGGGQRKAGREEDVVQLTDSNFNELVLESSDLWLVEFFAPWCGHCKTLAPEWASAASELKGKVKLGALDATVSTVIAGRYGVNGYPSIKMFASGSKDGEAADYEGGRTASDIVAWALEKLSENQPAPDVLQLTVSSVLSDACDERQLCVVAFLPHILDCPADCRNDFLSVLRKLGEKYKRRQWGWVWAEAGSQPSLEEAVEVGGFGYPAMVAINSRKMKFATLKGSFGETGINEFLRALAVGRGSTASLRNPKLPDLASIDAWDGKDGEMPQEEEIDLSDVTLDDLDDVTKEEL